MSSWNHLHYSVMSLWTENFWNRICLTNFWPECVFSVCLGLFCLDNLFASLFYPLTLWDQREFYARLIVIQPPIWCIRFQEMDENKLEYAFSMHWFFCSGYVCNSYFVQNYSHKRITNNLTIKFSKNTCFRSR